MLYTTFFLPFHEEYQTLRKIVLRETAKVREMGGRKVIENCCVAAALKETP